MSNPCIRCGKERIVLKTWTDKVGNFPLTHTTTGCPDKACQKVLNDEMEAAREKREAMLLLKKSPA